MTLKARSTTLSKAPKRQEAVETGHGIMGYNRAGYRLKIERPWTMDNACHCNYGRQHIKTDNAHNMSEGTMNTNISTGEQL